MYRIALGLLIVGLTTSASAQQSLLKVDFKNFTYPFSGSTLGHDRLCRLILRANGTFD